MLKQLEKYGWFAIAILFGTLFSYTLLNPSIRISAFIVGALALASTTYFYGFKKEWVFLGISFAIPLSVPLELPGTGISLSLPSELLEFLLLGVSLMYLLLKPLNYKLIKHPLTLLLILDIFWLLIASFFSSIPEVSFKRVIMKINYFMVFYILFTQSSSKKTSHLVKPYIFYVFGLGYVMIATLMKHVYYDFNPRVVFKICAPFYNDHTIYGAALAFITPILGMLVLHRKILANRPILKSTLVLLFLLVIISQVLALSRAALLSLVFVLIFYILIRLKASFLFLLGSLMVVVGTVAVFQSEITNYFHRTEAVSNDGNVVNHVQSVSNVSTDASNLERINRWVSAYRMFQEKPFLGFGPGTYQFEYVAFQSPEYKTYISTNYGDRGNAHSEYLTYLSESGIPGLIIFLVVMLYTVNLGINTWRKHPTKTGKTIALGALLGLLTFFFHGIFNTFSDQDEMAFLVYISFGALAYLDVERKNIELTNYEGKVK